MLEIYIILFTFFLTLVLNFYSKKKQFLVDKKFTLHKSYTTKNLSPITGGLIFLISCLFFLIPETSTIKLFLLSIFIIGFLSDTNYLFSPLKRFLLQIIVMIIFIYINQIFINSVRVPIIDNLLENILFKYIFTIFCFLVLMNGANFMDGVNTLLLGYFFILSLMCLLIINKFNLPFDIQNYKIIIIILGIILFFNFFGKLFSGDSGAYLISFIVGYFLIEFTNSTNKISPYFIACLLWYPAYESLFSIIRKKVTNKSITDPDNKHLHHLIFKFYKQKFRLKGNLLNTTTGLSINMINIIIFYNAFQNISQTKNLILLITISLLFYNFTYFYLNKTLK